MNAEEISLKEESIRNRAAQLDDTQKKMYFKRLSKELKDPDTYAVLNWIFIAGLHHFYLKRYLRGLVNLLTFTLGVGLFIGGYFIAGGVVISTILIMELYELFFSQSLIQSYNNDVSEKILDSL